jgi:two-component system, OmpR family, phosphate regulon response regulator PhoB
LVSGVVTTGAGMLWLGRVKERILIVDDERDILEVLRYNLEQTGFQVRTALDGRTALAELSRETPDLVVLDIMLPDMTGLEVCRRIRASERTSRLPILMLTAKAEEVDRVVGLEVGADDYVTKPFSPREVVLRIQSILRRSIEPPAVGKPLSHGGLELDPVRHRVTLDGVEIDLTTIEFKLLEHLMSRPGRVQTRDSLLETVWGYRSGVESRTVDTHVRRLREKIGRASELIETVRGVGYRFAEK